MDCSDLLCHCHDSGAHVVKASMSRPFPGRRDPKGHPVTIRIVVCPGMTNRISSIPHETTNVSKNLVTGRPSAKSWSPDDQRFGPIACRVSISGLPNGHAVSPAYPIGHQMIDRITFTPTDAPKRFKMWVNRIREATYLPVPEGRSTRGGQRHG